MAKKLIVTKQHGLGHDELYYYMYKCPDPKCVNTNIARSDRFCSMCGSKLTFDKSINHEI